MRDELWVLAISFEQRELRDRRECLDMAEDVVEMEVRDPSTRCVVQYEEVVYVPSLLLDGEMPDVSSDRGMRGRHKVQEPCCIAWFNGHLRIEVNSA